MAKMLDRVLSKIPLEKDEGKGSEAELHALRIQIGETANPLMDDSWEGKVKASSPRGKKRAASEDLEAETPKQGKKVSPGGSAATGTLTASCPPTGQPSTKL